MAGVDTIVNCVGAQKGRISVFTGVAPPNITLCNSGIYEAQPYGTGPIGILNPNPVAPLDVSGNINTNAAYQIGETNALSANGTALVLGGTGANAAYVGIGTNSPISPLQVDNPAPGALRTLLLRQTATGGGNLTFHHFSGPDPRNAVAGDSLIGNGVGNLLFSPNAAQKSLKFIGGLATNPVSMVITDGGNVGIGTLQPSSALDVIGNVQLQGAGNGIIFPDGSKQTAAATGLSLPFSATISSSSTLFSINNTGNSNTDGTAISAASDGPNTYAIYGSTTGNNSNGVYGFANGNSNVGVHGYSDPGGTAVYGDNASGNAGDFNGDLHVSHDVRIGGDLYVSGGKNFRIDHPLDPTNKYLTHSCVESDERKNVYDGMITTDGDGNALVRLPEYFEALNTDFRYQLTIIGQFAQAIVAKEIQNNEFMIKSDKPDVKVSWQVTGIRQDAYAKAHPFHAEEYKPEKERGLYLSPVEHGQPETMGSYVPPGSSRPNESAQPE